MNYNCTMTISESNSEEDPYAIQAVDPSWFQSPAEGLSTSGGTAAFYKLKLTEAGLKGVNSRKLPSFKNRTIDETYWIGKDLSHASDEKDFYLQVLQIRNEYQEGQTQCSKDLSEGIGLVEAFMFDYLGVLSTKTTESDEVVHLLVMRNMRNKYQHFRMLDLKIGEKTAQAGWKGKSRMRAMKHHLMDGLSNSAAEGYRLAGFNGTPEIFDSMDPLLDIMSTESLDDSNKSIKDLKEDDEASGWKTIWGKKIDNSSHAQAKRFMLNSLNGTGVFRFFYDLHMDGNPKDNPMEKYLPVEVAEIVAHELTKQLIELAAACHKVKIPQKWIGSSVAVCFDAGYFPDRNEELDVEQEIRSKVLCKIFDWGRSELLAAKDFEAMTPEQQKDREYFWDLYKKGIDRMSYNATRFYYHQFTKTTLYSDITIRCYDFDSMSADDYIGKVVIPLPDPSDESAMSTLQGSKEYKLTSSLAAKAYGSTITCSIVWEDFPESSRLKGAWKVTVEKATNLPPLDGIHLGTSDPYCMVMGNSTLEDGQHFVQRTCVKTRTLNPEWNETISVPVAREANLESLSKLTSSTKHELSDRLSWDKTWSFSATNKTDVNWWHQVLDGEK